MCNEFSAVTYFYKAVITSAVLSLVRDKCSVANQATSFATGMRALSVDTTSAAAHQRDYQCSTQLLSVPVLPRTCTQTHTLADIHTCVCVTHITTSNATKNNLAIHHAPLLPSSCHPDWQPRSSLMSQAQQSVNQHSLLQQLTLSVQLQSKCHA